MMNLKNAVNNPRHATLELLNLSAATFSPTWEKQLQSDENKSSKLSG